MSSVLLLALLGVVAGFATTMLLMVVGSVFMKNPQGALPERAVDKYSFTVTSALLMFFIILVAGQSILMAVLFSAFYVVGMTGSRLTVPSIKA